MTPGLWVLTPRQVTGQTLAWFNRKSDRFTSILQKDRQREREREREKEREREREREKVREREREKVREREREKEREKEREEARKEMFYLTMHSTHFIYGYMASDIWLRTILIVRKETRCRHIGYSYRLTARVLTPSHRQDNTYHGLCYTSRGALAGTRNSSMGPPYEGLIRGPIAP